MSPHYFRPAHASHALENAVDLAILRDELGYASIAATNKYLHATHEQAVGSVLSRK